MYRKKVSHHEKIVKMCQFYSDSFRFFYNQLHVQYQKFLNKKSGNLVQSLPRRLNGVINANGATTKY
jgi:hypothetical protein